MALYPRARAARALSHVHITPRQVNAQPSRFVAQAAAAGH
jgi:hypothetical protein